MKIEDLTQGFKFYDVTRNNVYSYQYLCPHPNNKNYSILINNFNKEPLKIYNETLKTILEKSLFTYEAACNKEIELLEEHIQYLKMERGGSK